jgi:ABC-type antimicrobial peptide transport system permease subunit
MGLRLMAKSVMLAMRSKVRFSVFTAIYTVLVFWMALELQNYLDDLEANATTANWQMLIIAIFASVVLSILYAWIIVNYRRTEIATLKCIGWNNGDIQTLIIGEILWVSAIAVFITMEVLIHYAAGVNYYWYQEFLKPNNGLDIIEYTTNTKPMLLIWNVVYTVLLFMVSQVVGILVMYNKVLKLRPIIALRIVK